MVNRVALAIVKYKASISARPIDGEATKTWNIHSKVKVRSFICDKLTSRTDNAELYVGSSTAYRLHKEGEYRLDRETKCINQCTQLAEAR